MYSHALTCGSIPNTSSLLVSHLPEVAKSSDGRLHTIKYENEYSGFFNGSAVEWPCTYSLSDSLVNVFSSSNEAILLLDGYMTAIMKNDSEYFFFDSHERDKSGMPVITETGAGLLMYFKSQHQLEAHISALANKLRVTKFEIVPIKISNCSVKSNNSNLEINQPDDFPLPTQELSKDASGSQDSEKQHKQKNLDQVKVKQKAYYLKRKLTESPEQKEKRLARNREYKQIKKAASAMEIDNSSEENIVSQERYLSEFNSLENGPLHEQDWAVKNIQKFHRTLQFKIFQCMVCKEAWPLTSNPRNPNSYACARCVRDKSVPQKFSAENLMIPARVPPELNGLTQVEEMLIARALPIMRVYVKPGGQRAYHGHCINLPQDVSDLASSLPHYSKDISVIVVKMKGKDNSTRDVTVRRHKVEDALNWLINHNPHYQCVTINANALDNLPVNGVPADILTVEANQDTSTDVELPEPDIGPLSEEDLIYNSESEMSSFLPVPQSKCQEIDAIRDKFSEASQPVNWPSLGDSPISEFSTPFLASMAFPCLFPDGLGDPTNPGIQREIPFHEKIKHLMKFAEKKDGKFFYRFATHPRFPYWALNMIQRKRALEQSNFYLKQNPSDQHLTIDELQEMIATNSSAALMTKMSRYVGNITGTNAYWGKVKEDLKSVILHVGPPTFFFTFSSADMHWPELHSLFTSPDTEIDPQKNRQNLIDNPHLVDWFFTKRLENFVKSWLYDTLQATWHWYRYEYQSRRGSIHCHGVSKLKNDPNLCHLAEKALEGYLAEKELIDCPDSKNKAELLRKIENGKEASKTICQYADWLLSTVNPLSPEENFWEKPRPHPCQRKYEDIDDMNTDYVDLLNTCQRHTRCSTQYCLKQKSNQSEQTCRFKFPFQLCSSTKLEFEQINTKEKTVKYRVKLVTRRNDPRLNNHQRLQLQGWRGNCDIQIIIDMHACVEYITKYAAKCEPKSPVLKQVLNSVMHNPNMTSTPNKLIKKIMMKSLGERDFSAQETMHHLMSLKLYSCSFNVLPVSLDGSRRLRNSLADTDSITDNSPLDVYANRGQFCNGSQTIMDMNFVDFTTKYKLTKNKLVRQPDNYVPRIFPTYSSNPESANFPLYCKYQLLRYKPWVLTQSNAWNNIEPSDDVFISAWKEFLQTPLAQSSVPNWLNKLADVENQHENSLNEGHVPVDNTDDTDREEWMILNDLTVAFHRNSHALLSNFNWHQNNSKYTLQQIGEMPSWISTKKENFMSQIHPQIEQIEIDKNLVSAMQARAYEIVREHNEHPSPKSPLHLIIIGVGGTGKSFLIHSLRQYLKEKCSVTAPTGKASYNVKGVTIHSLLKLPVGPKGHCDLKGQTLSTLQEQLKNVDYIIIDEYSMLGQITFGWIDKRLRQITGKSDTVCGGKSVILIGDQGQLSPVGDKPLYHSKPTNDIGLQGQFNYFLFNTVVKLTVNHRVAGQNKDQVRFRELLDRLRTGDSTNKDWKLLLTRQPGNIKNLQEFEDAVRLFFNNEDVANFNFKKLKQLGHPIAQVDARHSSKLARKLSSDEFSGLEPTIFLAKDATVMLTMNLWSTVGLCNGANGKIVDLIYDNDHCPPNLPIAVIVEFDDYSGPSFIESMPNCLPICPVTVSVFYSGSFHERQQLPLRLSWAMTIHKSQGLTLSKVWIDLGKSEKVAGISYVAISRARNLDSCVIEPMSFERLTSIKNSRNFSYRLEEEMRLADLAAKIS